MKWNESRRPIAQILVVAALLPVPWWRHIPVLKLLSMGMIIAAMQVLRLPRRDSASSGECVLLGESVDKNGLWMASLPVLGAGALMAIAFFVLTHSSEMQHWPVYFFAAAALIFFWTLSGLLMRLFR
jgi:hypothetical protein